MKQGIVVAIVLMATIFLGLWKVSKARSFQFFGEVVWRVERADSFVALTFDDGPAPRYTKEVLSILRERDVKATFFITGREAEIYPGDAKRIIAEGHELGNHSYSHATLVLKSVNRIRWELERTDRAIRNAGQRGKIYFRPPYGKKLFVLPWYLARTGRTTVMWDIEPESYPEVSREAFRIAAHITGRVRPGSIVLLHVMYESRAESRRALPLIIDSLRKEGYAFVTVSELIQKDGA